MSSRNNRNRRPVHRGAAVPMADMVNYAAGADLESLHSAIGAAGPFHLLQADGRPYSLARLTSSVLRLASVSRAFALALPDDERAQVIAGLEQMLVDHIADVMDPDGD